MSRKLVLIGGGGHCKSVLDCVLRSHQYDEIVITDNDLPIGTEIFGCRVAGNDDVLPELLKSGFTDAFITVGSVKSTKLRRILHEKAVQIGFQMPNIIDPSAIVSDYASMGTGIFVGKAAVINADAEIHDCAIINSAAVIEHECTVGAFTHISVGAKLCGNVRVGDDTLIGAGSVVIQGVQIGDHVIIGAGSTVIGNVRSKQTKVGLIKR